MFNKKSYTISTKILICRTTQSAFLFKKKIEHGISSQLFFLHRKTTAKTLPWTTYISINSLYCAVNPKPEVTTKKYGRQAQKPSSEMSINV